MKVTKRAWRHAAHEYRDKLTVIRDNHDRLLDRQIKILKRESRLISNTERLLDMAELQNDALKRIPARAIRSAIRTDLDICADCTGEEDCEDSCECVCHDDSDAARCTVVGWLKDSYGDKS